MTGEKIRVARIQRQKTYGAGAESLKKNEKLKQKIAAANKGRGGLRAAASGEWRADADADAGAGLDHASRVRELQKLEVAIGIGQSASGRGLWYSVET